MNRPSEAESQELDPRSPAAGIAGEFDECRRRLERYEAAVRELAVLDQSGKRLVAAVRGDGWLEWAWWPVNAIHFQPPRPPPPRRWAPEK